MSGKATAMSPLSRSARTAAWREPRLAGSRWALASARQAKLREASAAAMSSIKAVTVSGRTETVPANPAAKGAAV